MPCFQECAIFTILMLRIVRLLKLVQTAILTLRNDFTTYASLIQQYLTERRTGMRMGAGTLLLLNGFHILQFEFYYIFISHSQHKKGEKRWTRQISRWHLHQCIGVRNTSGHLGVRLLLWPCHSRQPWLRLLHQLCLRLLMQICIA